MPAFTFEKIAPPPRIASSSAPHQNSQTSFNTKPAGSRGFVGHMLDRLTVSRLQREQARKPRPVKPR
jgi:hypothetical protein